MLKLIMQTSVLPVKVDMLSTNAMFFPVVFDGADIISLQQPESF